uniref:Cyclin dependent kinase 15 n=1 Tax=Athene cunicularia TaxID=194338 RepID=A0A663LY50_ATHCN
LPSLQLPWLHMLRSWRCRMQRPWSYTDPFQEQDVVERFTWVSILFGAATSYVHLEKLCEGSCATVYKGISRINGQLVALKVIRMQAEEGVPFRAIWEASLLKRLKHANIVLLHDIIQTKETLTFVFEYMHTDLAQYMGQHPGGLHSCNAMVSSLEDYILLDLVCPRGIFQTHCQYLTNCPNIAGFFGCCFFAGLARTKTIPRQTYSSEVVTLWYRPPDLLLGATDYSSDLDIWSAGCIFVEMIQGQPVFAGTSGTHEQLVKIWAVLGVPTEDTWPGLSNLPKSQPVPQPRLSRVPAAEDLASRMLTAFPRGRISAQDALLHGFFSPLPPQVYRVPAGQSLLTVPGVRLQPEICDLFASYKKGQLSGGSSKFW